MHSLWQFLRVKQRGITLPCNPTPISTYLIDKHTSTQKLKKNVHCRSIPNSQKNRYNPSTDEWIHKVWYIMECFSIKMNDTGYNMGEPCYVKAVRHKRTNNTCFRIYEMPRIGKSTETQNILVAAWRQGRGWGRSGNFV